MLIPWALIVLGAALTILALRALHRGDVAMAEQRYRDYLDHSLGFAAGIVVGPIAVVGGIILLC